MRRGGGRGGEGGGEGGGWVETIVHMIYLQVFSLLVDPLSGVGRRFGSGWMLEPRRGRASSTGS